MWAKSGNRCAICGCALTEADQSSKVEIPIGVEAHIVSSRPDGPRHTELPPEEQDTYENLILLCPNDHKVVDDQDRLDHWTVGRLRDTKARHEAGVGQHADRYGRPTAVEAAIAQAEAIDFVQRRNQHREELREFLGRIPYGKPAGSLLWDDLHEHLGAGHAVWSLEGRMRKLVQAATRTDVVNARLFDELKSRGLVLSGSQGVLSRRLNDAIEGKSESYPDLEWFTEPSFGDRLLKFGGGYGIAHINTFVEAAQLATAQRDLWDQIPNWPEVVELYAAGKELVAVRAQLGHELAELHHSPDFPTGSCRHCPRAPRV